MQRKLVDYTLHRQASIITVLYNHELVGFTIYRPTSRLKDFTQYYWTTYFIPTYSIQQYVQQTHFLVSIPTGVSWVELKI